MRRAALAILCASLAVPAAARAAGSADAPPAFELSGAAALVLAAAPSGDGPERRGGLGLRAAFDPGIVARPWFARPEAVWLHVAWDDGTRAVNVATAVDTLGLPLAAGWEWRGASGDLRVAPYLAAGPTLVRTAARFHVADPLAGTGDDRSWAAYDVGALYGAGARLSLAVGPSTALSLRLEALGLRRGVADDLALAAGLGVLF